MQKRFSFLIGYIAEMHNVEFNQWDELKAILA